MCECMCVCACVSEYMCECVCMCECICVRMCAHVNICVHVSVGTSVSVYFVCMCPRMLVCEWGWWVCILVCGKCVSVFMRLMKMF